MPDNMRRLSEWVLALKKCDVHVIEIAAEIFPLLDTLGKAVDYDSVEAKQSLLENYFTNCMHTLSGRKVAITLPDLAADLATKANWLCNHLRTHEWLTNSEGYSWFNGYYDNDGQRVEGDFPKGVRMTLNRAGLCIDGRGCQ